MCPYFGQTAIFIDKMRVLQFLEMFVKTEGGTTIVRVTGVPTLAALLCQVAKNVQILRGPVTVTSNVVAKLFYSLLADAGTPGPKGKKRKVEASPREEPPSNTVQRFEGTNAFACKTFVVRDDSLALRKWPAAADLLDQFFIAGPNGIRVYPLEVSTACLKNLSDGETARIPTRAQLGEAIKVVVKMKKKAIKIAKAVDTLLGVTRPQAQDDEMIWDMDIIHFPPGLEKLALVGGESDALVILDTMHYRPPGNETAAGTWPIGSALAHLGSAPVTEVAGMLQQGYYLRVARRQVVPFWKDKVFVAASRRAHRPRRGNFAYPSVGTRGLVAAGESCPWLCADRGNGLPCSRDL